MGLHLKDTSPTMKTFLRDIIITFVLAAVIFLGLQTTIQKFAVDGPSMQPRLQHGQQILVNKAVYKLFHEPERGDIVIFDSPENRQGDFVKRIIGLPGESVEIRKGIVYIHIENGTVVPLDEPYVDNPAMTDFQGDKIPENEYFAHTKSLRRKATYFVYFTDDIWGAIVLDNFV